jgi:uncharacterized protein with NRDE domain
VCTFILLHRPDLAGATEAWPLIVAANRDEMLARPWEPPAEHWPDQPGVIGGLDTLAGGTWLGMNGAGVVAGVLNRTGSLGPSADKRSRGELPLLALRHRSAAAAAGALAALDGREWRSFNLVVADNDAAFFVRGLGTGPVVVRPLPAGMSMVTAADPNDTSNPRVARHLPRFQAAAPPDPPDWGSWPDLLADGGLPRDSALCVPAAGGFGTVSSMLIAVAPGRSDVRFWAVK